MGTLVYLEMAALSKCFVTHITNVRLVTSVNPYVCEKVAADSKCFVTHVTAVWSVSSVNTFVYLETA